MCWLIHWSNLYCIALDGLPYLQECVPEYIRSSWNLSVCLSVCLPARPSVSALHEAAMIKKNENKGSHQDRLLSMVPRTAHAFIFVQQKARLQQWIGIITFAVWVLDSSAATKNRESALNQSHYYSIVSWDNPHGKLCALSQRFLPTVGWCLTEPPPSWLAPNPPLDRRWCCVDGMYLLIITS